MATTMSEEIERFHIQVPEAVLEDLRTRLANTRFAEPPLPEEGWAAGTASGYLRELCEYWRNGFDWRAEEARLNRLEHFRTRVDGVLLHFIHARSPEPGALPLLLSHGWPGSVLEFMKVIGPLTHPTAHGGRAEDAFHVICPSLPGFGFSEAPREPGWSATRVARAFAGLMKLLGYSRYGAQGGDWGAFITANLGLLDAEHLCGIHLNLVPCPPPPGTPREGRAPVELSRLSEFERYQANETGYQAIQTTKPQTLAHALNDSPAGLAAWIVEKFRNWSDCGGEVESRFTRDELLANITWYWATQTIGSSFRIYYETKRAGRHPFYDKRVEVPTGCTIFPRELFRPPRRWAERVFNVQHWEEKTSGGHFATMEEPQVMVDELRTFFRKLRR
jgi:microsomal epoxide hydrolase